MFAPQPVSSTLSTEEAAAYLGFSTSTFTPWIRRGLLPRADPETGGWTKEALDQAIERIQREGVQHDKPRRRHSRFIKIYHAHRVWKSLETGEGHWFFRFRPTGEPLPGDWGSPAFMTALIDCERRYAAKQKATALAAETSPSPPTATSTTSVSDQSPPVAQPSPAGTAKPTKVVTQEFASRLKDGLRAPAELASKMRRRRAAVTQAEIARIIRAAKQAGAPQIEVRLSDSASVVVRLQPDNSIDSTEDIIL